MKSTPCGHIFCAECLEMSANHSKQCPKCRKKIVLKRCHPIFPDLLGWTSHLFRKCLLTFLTNKRLFYNLVYLFLELSENALVTTYPVESTMGINVIFIREKCNIYQMNPQTPNINVLRSGVRIIYILSTDYLLLFDHFILSNETHAEW